MVLKCDLFRDTPRMQAAGRNSPALWRGETGIGPALLQAGLIELGYALPVSTAKTGAPDGIYGAETQAAVKRFQAANPPLASDGVAGAKTLAAMDAKLPVSAQPAPKPPKPQPGPPPKPQPKPQPQPPAQPKPPQPPLEPKPQQPPPHDKFKLGSGDPPLRHDAGSGPWNSEWPSLRTLAIMAVLSDPVRATAFYGSCMAAVGPNATRNLRHYLGNSGTALTIPYDNMVKATERARYVFLSEVLSITDYIDAFPAGTWAITSKVVRQDEDTYNYQGETRDWYFAIGGYGVWSKANVVVSPDGQIQAAVTVKFYDRYNWDGGKSVELAGITITDEFMAEFHRQGVAKEYDCVGSTTRNFVWKRGNPPGEANIA